MRVSKLCPKYRYARKTQISLDLKKYRYVGVIWNFATPKNHSIAG
jgi:hypothetical protein